MKKLFVLFGLLLVSSVVFAQVKTPYTEFMAKNPFLEADVYVLNPNLLKGKILKTTSEEYDILEDGRKVYGDGLGANTGIWYYKFNDENQLERKYYLSKQNNRLFSRKMWTYTYGENEYTVVFNNYDWNETKEEKYVIKKDDPAWKLNLEYYFSDWEMTTQIKMNDAIKLKLEQKYDWDPKKDIYRYSNPTTEIQYYNGDELQRTMLYHNGRLISNVQEGYLGNGKIVRKIEFDKTYTEGILKSQIFMDGEMTEEKLVSKISRTYNPKGYLETETVVPYSGKTGSYENYSVEILSAEDDELLSIFSPEV